MKAINSPLRCSAEVRNRRSLIVVHKTWISHLVILDVVSIYWLFQVFDCRVVGCKVRLGFALFLRSSIIKARSVILFDGDDHFVLLVHSDNLVMSVDFAIVTTWKWLAFHGKWGDIYWFILHLQVRLTEDDLQARTAILALSKEILSRRPEDAWEPVMTVGLVPEGML